MNALVLPGISIRLIQRIVCDRFGLDLTAMESPSRKRRVAHPRQLAMRLSREFTAKSLPNIGRHFGGRDHTTVIHAIRAVERRNQRSESASRAYQELRTALELIAPKPAEEDMPDLYQELGIGRDASPHDIKAAHRKAVREHHPDRGGDQARFQAVQLAYDTLRDEEKRRRYDETGETAGAAQGDVATQMLAMLVQNLIDQMLQEGVPIETADMRQLMVDGAKGKIAELRREKGQLERSIARAENLAKRWTRKPKARGPDLIGDTIARRERDLRDSLKRLGEAEEAWTKAAAMLDDYEYDFEERRSATAGSATGWAVCGRVNAKNRMGGYSGETWALIMFFNGEPIRVDIGDPLGDPSPASLSCDPWLKSGTLKPLQPSLASIVASNEARGMASATAIAAQGGYGISYVTTPCGIYVMAVAPGSRASAAGLKAGAVVSSINGQAARTMTNDQVKAIIAGRTATGFDLKLIDGSTVHLPPL